MAADASVLLSTRLRDFQALLRREQLKQRDSGVNRLLFAVLDSRANRAAVADASAIIGQALPANPWTVWRALKSGRLPEGDALLYV